MYQQWDIYILDGTSVKFGHVPNCFCLDLLFKYILCDLRDKTNLFSLELDFEVKRHLNSELTVWAIGLEKNTM